MRCNYCEWRCKMPASVCHMYEERDGTITEIYPNQWTTYYLTHAEGIPLFTAGPIINFYRLVHSIVMQAVPTASTPGWPLSREGKPFVFSLNQIE